MRIGLVCPYSWDVPGGVQSHVRDLARVLRTRGHEVGVLAPGGRSVGRDDEGVETIGRAVPVPYNGSVARLAFGPRAVARTRRWLSRGGFDLIHVHEPFAPSLSLVAVRASEAPVVATFHSATSRSRAMASASSILQPTLSRIAVRIAVSEAARETLVAHLGTDAIVIPNGIDYHAFADAGPSPDWQSLPETIAFLGRIDEPRKGFRVALDTFAEVRTAHPSARFLVGGPVADARAAVPAPLDDGVSMLGVLSDADRARLMSSADVFLAPNTHGESFGIVVVEAMASGAAVVCSDLPAFRSVLGDGRVGRLFPVGDAGAAAAVTSALLSDRRAREELGALAESEAKRFDWGELIGDIEAIYASVLAGGLGG
jgi:phosphatidylinositol alpha-mannosyltransferase